MLVRGDPEHGSQALLSLPQYFYETGKMLFERKTRSIDDVALGCCAFEVL